MNTTEHIVETYFRVVKNCFTYSDFKVKGGNNRQFDVLAFSPIENSFRHIEVSVTHNLGWNANLETLKEEIGYKFFGNPRNSKPDNPNTDASKGKRYLNQIREAYSSLGVQYDKVIRVWCLWCYTGTTDELWSWKKDLEESYGIPADQFELLSFRDTIIPELFGEIGTSHYSDEILRAFSLIKEFEKQKDRT